MNRGELLLFVLTKIILYDKIGMNVMRNKLSKLLRGITLSFFGILNFVYSKAVHAAVIYASPEVMKRDAYSNFIEKYTGFIIFVFLLAIIGVITIVKVLFLKIFKKKR